MFLDIEEKHTYADIAAALSVEFKEKISIHGLKDLIKTREFDEAYNGLLPEITTDPRYRAARSQATDMLSRAMTELETLMTSISTPAGVKLRAIEKVLDLNGITAPKEAEGDTAELSRFLASRGMLLNQTNNILVLPPGYEDALEQFAPNAMTEVASTQEETIEAEFIHEDTH